MTKPTKYRELAKLLRAAGFTPEEGKGDHERWVYPGLTRKALNAIAKKKGQDQ